MYRMHITGYIIYRFLPVGFHKADNFANGSCLRGLIPSAIITLSSSEGWHKCTIADNNTGYDITDTSGNISAKEAWYSAYRDYRQMMR